MRRRITWCSILLVTLVGIGCGNDESSTDNADEVMPPENPERALPTSGSPQDDEFEEPEPPPEYVREDYVTNQSPRGECCPVVFAFAPPNPAEIQEAVLRGSLFPIDSAEGLLLDEEDGVWSGETCLAPDRFGTYYYHVGLRTSGTEELFWATRYNPYAPTTSAAIGVVNAWLPEEDCALLDVSVHAQISE